MKRFGRKLIYLYLHITPDEINIFPFQDKLLFSLMLAKNLWNSKSLINQTEWLFFLTGGANTPSTDPSSISWISNDCWARLQQYVLNIFLKWKNNQNTRNHSYYITDYLNIQRLSVLHNQWKKTSQFGKILFIHQYPKTCRFLFPSTQLWIIFKNY